MPQIGEFTRHQTGYSGRIRTLRLNLEVAIVAAEASDADNAPDYHVHTGGEDGIVMGAGWKHASEKAGEFVSLYLDDPTFAQPIRAYLFQNVDGKKSWSLHWSRQRDRAEKD